LSEVVGGASVKIERGAKESQRLDFFCFFLPSSWLKCALVKQKKNNPRDISINGKIPGILKPS
jgi:hypothetical protein